MTDPGASPPRQQPSTAAGRPSYPLPVAHRFVPGGCLSLPDATPYSLAQVHPAALAAAHDADARLWRHNAQHGSHLPVLPSLAVLAEGAFARLTGCHAQHARDWAEAMVLQYSTTAGKETTVAALLKADAGTAAAASKGPCGYVFMRGDIAWNCRTCQTDPTCVVCDACFRSSNHDGHEVYFHRTTPGGCCDCGDVEAWARDGCCEAHRPELPEPGIQETSPNDPMEAVAICAKGYRLAERAIQECGLEPMVLAALGVVIGAAVHAIVEAFDGAAIGADPTQWRLKWAEEAARIVNKQAFNDDAVDTSQALVTPVQFLEPVLEGSVAPLPEGYHLQLRLHNDDVHTYEEVIEALHDPRPGRRSVDGSRISDPSLVSVRERAQEMTQHVDSDGQVTVKTYSTIPTAMQGFQRLKSKGLHGAVVSSSQVQLEMRANNLTTWLQEIAGAHPAAAALVVHALVQVDPDHDLAGVHVWRQSRMIPLWAGIAGSNDIEEIVARRFDAFPPNLLSSYCTREEAEMLHDIAMANCAEAFLQVAYASPAFYSQIVWRLPSERYKKSPHALWGTLPSLYSHSAPLHTRHPLLHRLMTGMTDLSIKSSLIETVYVIDTDLRKQTEADQLTSSLFPHKLPGLHMISGIGTINANEISHARPLLPSPMELRHLLANSSFRAPMSPIIMLLLSDPYPTKNARATLHSLFLSLLTDSRFRCRFAGAIAVAYRPLTTLFCAGVGTESDTPLHFTVQIFTAGSLIRALGFLPAIEKLLLTDKVGQKEIHGASIGVFVSPIAFTIVRCIHTNVLGATKEVTMILKNTISGSDDNSADDIHRTKNENVFPSLTYVAGEHPLVTALPAAPDDGFLDSRLSRHKRLPHLLRDLEYVIETTGTAMRLLLPSHFPIYPEQSSTIREDFLTFASVYSRMLRQGQGIDPQKRKISGGHVEYEQNRWLEAFGLSLNLAGTRDALAESAISISVATLLTQSMEKGSFLPIIREAAGSLIAALLREIKWWLYQECVLETGLPVSPAHGILEIAQAETLQRSTLHVSCSQFMSDADDNAPTTIALSCATGIKMTENQLSLIENALRAEITEKEHPLQPARSHGAPRLTAPTLSMIDWLRVPHSPLGGDSLSFHLPLHRALAKCVRSILGLAVPATTRTALPGSWWKIPVLDMDLLDDAFILQHHPLVPLIGKTLRYQNCRVTWSSGPECSAPEAQRRKARSRTISANIAAAKVLHSLADHPLRCIAAAQQIERHLWARNGSSVAGMAMNYSSAPLCRSFRDLDIFLVQLSASGMSCGLGARRTYALMLSRFNMDGYLIDPERRSQSASASGVFASGSGVWVPPPRLTDPDHAVVLSESFFATLCVIVSELPPCPPMTANDDNPLKQVVRRELLHALAAEPRSHSEALSAASVGISRREESERSASRFRDAFAEVLRDIAKQKSTSSRVTGPPCYELKPDFCDEYDPTFFHLRRNEHQHAMDVIARLRKQKINALEGPADTYCLPLVCAPPKAHPRLLPCRLLLHVPAMDAALRRSLLFALTGGSWLPPPEPAVSEDVADDTPWSTLSTISKVPASSCSPSNEDVPVTSIARRFLQSPSSSSIGRRTQSAESVPFSKEIVAASSVSFLEVLQLLTLQIHTLEECASLHMILPDLDDESRALSSGLSINSFLSRLIEVPESLADVWALKPHPEGPLTSRGSGERRGSILGLLIALYEHRADHAALLDTDNGESSKPDSDEHGGARALSTSGLKWLLRFVSALVDGAKSVGMAIKCATTGVPMIMSQQNERGASSWTINVEVSTTVAGMLADLPDLWPKKRETVTTPPDKVNSKSNEARKAAQKRILERMKKQQAAFAATMDPSSTSSMAGSAETEVDLCIICRCDDTDGETNGPLGYLGHVQRSRVAQLRSMIESTEQGGLKEMIYSSYRVVGHMGCQLRETESMDSKPLACLPKGSIVTVLKVKMTESFGVQSRRVLVRHVQRDTNLSTEVHTEGWASVRSSHGYVILSPLSSICYTSSNWGSTRPIIKQCGHAAHLTCVETHMASLHQRSAADQPYDGRFAANIREGEFLCPLCKQLSNILIPRENMPSMQGTSLENVRDKNELASVQVRPLRALLTGRRMAELSSDHFQGLAREALSKFGIHLYNGMSAGYDSGKLRRNKEQHWHRAIRKWDYEEEDLEGNGSENDLTDNVGSILRLLRQQLIAWSAVGYGASAAESATRGIEANLPFGVVSQTNEPWPSFKGTEKDSHPMLLELMRTLTAASRYLDVLCLEMKEILSRSNMVTGDAWIVGACIADILDGQSWITRSESPETEETKRRVALWSEITAQITSMPCHVARDGALLYRCEARATAAEMWAIKGIGTDNSRKGDPPTPLAVSRVLDAGLPPMPRGWGSMNPYINENDKDTIPEPFRPGVAAAFLYKPLLIWDLNSLAGAVFSNVLANSNDELPSNDELCQIAQILLVGRLVQAISTPFGVDLSQEIEEDSTCWNESEKQTEGVALGKLIAYCRTTIKNKGLHSSSEMNEDTKVSPEQLLCIVGEAILPFARSLVLILRAASAVIRQRKSVSLMSDSANHRIFSLIYDEKLMSCEDGFQFFKLLEGPFPSALTKTSGPWKYLIDRWLCSAIGYEMHHGSMGKSTILDPKATTYMGWVSESVAVQDSKVMQEPVPQVEMDIDEPVSHSSRMDTEAVNSNMFVEEFMNDSDDELDVMDEAEELVDLGGQTLDAPILQSHSNNVSSSGSVMSEDYSSSGSEGDASDSDREFAHVSRSPILPFQPSTLAIEGVGPGRQGTQFEFASASAVMADLSHLGLVHRSFVPTFSYIRLPHSFVELYNMVNKIKGREDSHADSIDEVGNSETAICLLTGAVMRAGSYRRQSGFARSFRQPGTCTMHARKNGSGIGVFFLVQKCTVLLMHNNKSAYSPSIYVDEHGEEDPGLRRGRPLFLNKARYQALESLWRQHGIPREVAQIRSTSDRVIRDNWY